MSWNTFIINLIIRKNQLQIDLIQKYSCKMATSQNVGIFSST